MQRGERYIGKVALVSLEVPILTMDDHRSVMNFGERLRQLRILAGLNQTELGRRARVPQSIISALEGGRQRTVNLDTAKRLADALGVSLDLLAGRTGETRE